ncbi:hypothetical protein [Streptomyces malaysiense]|uniref:Uncharacterized protein n=1 Tax=Streptomyces malaysiense TaxID=1428626 RepID=A0A1J4PYU7_9ACTN|nr:hypothetical protein [Streptomyces malaysiense]OIK25866.1 hypothetical protein VT52_019275 [Streptomyces malaysiense]
MNLRSSWAAETGQTREDTRLTQMGATTPTNPLEVRSGVLPGSYDGRYRVSGFWLEGGAGTMTATVHEGRAVIQAGSTQGAYPVTLPEPATLTFADGDATNPRLDLVVLRIYDNVYDSSGFTKAALEIVQGTPAAAPAWPALPGITMPIYEVKVQAGTGAGNGGVDWSSDDVRDLRTTTVAAGGILPAYGDTGNGAYPGQYRDSGGALQRWDGSAWVSYPSALGGIAPAGTVTTASYTGQYRDSSSGVLQRWNGSSWVSYQPLPTWTDYTPVWGAENGTAPSIGNGTLAGSYAKLGTVVHVRIYLKIGSTTNLSAQDSNGNWDFSLPVPPVSTTWKLDGRVLDVLGFDDSANLLYQGSGLLSTNGGGVVRSLRETLHTAGDIWDKGYPFTWASGDVLSIYGTYESAS